MQELGTQLLLVIGILAICFTGPAVAMWFLIRRKRNARARRRSPIGIDLLRGPGYSLREQLIEAETDLILDLSLLVVIPLLTLTIFLAQKLTSGPVSMVEAAVIYLLGTIAFLVYAVRKLLRAGAKLDRLRAGYDAELAVGQELDQLMRLGASVFHDIPADNFNIDHVVVSPAGIFAVETKGFTKQREGGREAVRVVYDGSSLRFPNWTTKKPLEQAEWQASWLSRWLSSAIGDPVSVIPVLALPGWFVDQERQGTVRVFSGRQLSGLLAKNGSKPLTPQEVQRVAHQIEQRCRTVAPKYADNDSRAK